MESIDVPCAVVGFPTTLEIGTTFGRYADHAVFPVWIIVGVTATKDARDTLSGYIAGGSDIEAAIRGTYSWGDVDVMTAGISTIPVNGITYLALQLTVDVTT